MDDLQKNLFDEGWKKLEINVTDCGSILDRIYQREVITHQQFILLRDLKTSEALQEVQKILGRHELGFEILKEITQAEYAWIYEEIKILNDRGKKEEKIFNDALKFGNVPIDRFYIKRTQKLEQLKKALIDMQAHTNNKIVLYGMNGIGKTSLAAAVLSDKSLLLNNFNNKVYWINDGHLEDDQKILEEMFRLYRKIRYSDEQLTELPEEMPSCIALMRDNLQLLFRKPSYQKSLIILDNVNGLKVIESFNNCCNLLIVSQERLTMQRERITYISVADGFSEMESLQVFAHTLACSYEDVAAMEGPKTVHNWCKGDPTLITLCTTLMEPRAESLRRIPKAWDDFMKILSKQSNIPNQRFQTIKLCYDNLEANLQHKYQDLAVFVDDINIMPQVLATLWDEEQFSVEEVMTRLHNKSLIVCDFNQQLGNYIYGIHHVFLNFLKRNLKEEDMISLHKKLINAYKAKFKEYSKFPNDNYIFQYIGHHLKGAHLFEEFNIYFDLTFLGAKIRATGIADVLRDFELYKSYITNSDAALQEKLESYIEFVNIYGQNLQTYPYTDIVQSGLQLKHDNPVRKAALKIAQEKSDRLYFHWHAPHESNYYTHKLTLEEPFNVACFTDEPNQILVGTKRGDIELWEQQYEQKLQTFSGHTDTITHIIVKNDQFVSMSLDGTAKLWNLTDYQPKRNSNTFINSSNEVDLYIPSPRVKQNNHQIFFGSETIIDRCETYSLEGDKLCSVALSNQGDLILTGTVNGRVVLWDKNEIRFNKSYQNSIKCVAFSYDDNLIFASFDSKIIVVDSASGKFISQLHNKSNQKVNALHVIPYTENYEIISVSDHSINKWIVTQKLQTVDTEQISLVENKISRFICSTVTENYLIYGSDDTKLKMLDLTNNTVVQEFSDQNGEVICLDTSINTEDNSLHVLLTGFEDKTVKLWHVRLDQDERQALKNLSVYASYWNLHLNESSLSISSNPLVAIVNAEGKIQILKGYKLVAETDLISNQIKAIVFSQCGNNIFYGLSNGDVYTYKLKTKESQKVMTLGDEIAYMDAIDMDSAGAIVVSSVRGTLFIYYNNTALKLMQISDKINHPNIAPILRSFYITANAKLLTISRKTVMYWSVPSLRDVHVLYSNNDASFNSTCLSSDETLLCVTTRTNFHIFRLHDEGDASGFTLKELMTNKSKRFETTFTCCSFSSRNRYLAIGCENGDILVWKVAENTFGSVIKMHQECIRSLSFSPEELILVSVGEQIAWWNLQHLPEDRTRRSFRSSSNSMKKPAKLDLSESMSQLNISNAWLNRKGTDGMPHLLATIKLHGLYSNYISNSSDFASFLTVDNQGELYIMEVLDNY